MKRIVIASLVAACLAAGVLVPGGAVAATECTARVDNGVSDGTQMKDKHEPYIDTTPHTVGKVPGYYVSTPALYDLKDMPKGATWAIATQDNLTAPIKVQRRGEQLELFLQHNLRKEGAPHPSIQPGPNTTDKLDIRICYPDNSTELVQMHPQLVPEQSFLYDLTYEPQRANPGQQVTIRPKNGNYREFNANPLQLPADASWSVTSHARWAANIDEQGVVTTTVPQDSRAGSEFTVTVHYADDTTDEARFTIANTGKGTTDKPSVPPAAKSGSSGAQIAALVIGLIAAIGGAVAFLLPQLARTFGDGLHLPV
ncbi:Rib/alpha-like domain-containing protein [Corynebacterium sp. HMSC074A01]|uniref:Rib/alpha-like domain-containing protein n=1 Tax=Corynebacterium sp. HMSC074A01 TaxID=1715030 RepID=UPI0008A36096|nr:Rib/alpha-like domain-containing protein [Corynebacterium sp. HMSC074A01]OHF36118.1 hypothetical protein HMPREF2550_09620 [Corynebacterium sp. HMSC074A01]